jgi:sugar lactone lactonase YvrE
MRSRVARLVVALVALQTASVLTQQRGGTPQTDKVPAVNSGANPYRVIRDWARLDLEARPWGGSNGVAIDRDGRSVWATDRCSPGTSPGCLGSKGNPVHLFDQSGKEVRSFGGGMFVWPHGIHADRDGNVWVTDARAPTPEDLAKFPGEGGKGSVVVKFSPEGKVLMTLGVPGVSGGGTTHFNAPSDVVVAPNGDVFIADGHGLDGNNRVVKFSKEGKFLKEWGKTGYGPGEFRTLHAIAMDSRGRIFVGDRSNNRIQLFDQEGKFLTMWTQFGRPSGIFFDERDRIYVADSESDDVQNPGWEMGIRIGDAKTGWISEFIMYLWGDPRSTAGNGAEFVAVDREGNLYGGEPSPRKLQKYVRVRP